MVAQHAECAQIFDQPVAQRAVELQPVTIGSHAAIADEVACFLHREQILAGRHRPPVDLAERGLQRVIERIADLLEPGSLTPGVYQMRFDTGAYHQAQGVEGFYPEALITFEIKETSEHYHIPLLLSPFGYSTYRGS